METKIEEILTLFLKANAEFWYGSSNASLYGYKGSELKEFFAITVKEWNCILLISSPNTNGIKFDLQYLKDNEGNESTFAVSYFIEDWSRLKPLLNEVIKNTQDQYNAERMYIESANDYIEIFKEILAEKESSKKMNYRIVENALTTNIILKEFNKEHTLTVDGTFTYAGKSIDTLLGCPEIQLEVQEAQEYIKLIMLIPGYELEDYPMFNTFRKEEVMANSNCEEWIKEIINLPNVPNTELQKILTKFILESELPNKTNNAKIIKKKI